MKYDNVQFMHKSASPRPEAKKNEQSQQALLSGQQVLLFFMFALDQQVLKP